MSQENVETLRRGYQAFADGDLETALGFMDSEIAVFDHDRILDTPRAYHGHEGIVQMTAEAAESFKDHRYEPEEFIDAGDRVVVAIRRRGRGKASQVEVDEPQWHAWTFRGTTAVEFRAFVSKPEALKAAGLSE
jgi:ketosteroid isomerase-like protein